MVGSKVEGVAERAKCSGFFSEGNNPEAEFPLPLPSSSKWQDTETKYGRVNEVRNGILEELAQHGV